MYKKYLLLNCLFYSCTFAQAQTVTNRLRFEQGKKYEISLHIKTTIAQQAMGQAIDFNVEATGIHGYQVTNTTEENTTLNHHLDQVLFTFDGMGQKMNFDSRKEKDINGAFGKPIRELLDKKYDIIIDSGGTTLAALPEKVELSHPDSRMALITSMLRDVTELVQPPQKGMHSFFRVLPGGESRTGKAWTISYENASGKYEDMYSIEDISDSLVILNYAGSSVTVAKAEMMGNETTTRLNNKSTGRILVDRLTGIIREKNINTESNGTTESSFGSIPVTSKTTTHIRVTKRED